MHKKIPMVVYEYKPTHRFSNEDDCLGEIRFNFQEKTVEILKLADGGYIHDKHLCQKSNLLYSAYTDGGTAKENKHIAKTHVKP